MVEMFHTLFVSVFNGLFLAFIPAIPVIMAYPHIEHGKRSRMIAGGIYLAGIIVASCLLILMD